MPNNKISGGQLLSSKVPKRKNPVGLVFRHCSNSLWRSKEPLGDYFRHAKAKSGHLQAIMVATGKKLAVIFYTMVAKKDEYNPLVYSEDRKTQPSKSIEQMQGKLLRMQNELATCG